MATATYSDLSGKGVLVSGGATGIGEAIVRGFAGQGSMVGFVDIDKAAGEKLAAELAGQGATVRFAACDITDTPRYRDAIAEIRMTTGPITALVNNAARDDRHATEEVTPDYFDGRIAVNLKHAFFAAQAVIPDMKAAGGGAIVNFSSVSWLVGMGGMAVYTASKSAMIGLTRSLARDFGSYNIRANAIAPGWILTERQRTLWVTPESEKMRETAQCIKRWLLPDDIANFTMFLCSDVASACTAQHYIVDGGWA